MATALLERAAGSDWRGPDPYDGLWFGWPTPIVGGPRRRQAVVQLHARAPVDLRRLYRRRHPQIVKTLGLCGSAAAALHNLTGEERYAELARAVLAPLLLDPSAGKRGWGYPFDVQTRWSFYPAGSPNIVVTTYATRALAQASRALGSAKYSDIARNAAGWMLERLYLAGEGIFTYHEHSDTLIHNANLLGARAVHEQLGADPSASEAVRRALERTLAAQAGDGSFPYGDGPGLAWVDSFHTGFVLTCLAAMEDVDPRVPEALERGSDFYASRFFKASGAAKLWPGKDFPEDGHSTGTGMTALAALAARDRGDVDLLTRAVSYTIDEMIRGGHAVFRRYARGRSTVRYIRWCDAHVALGLADAATVLSAQGRTPVGR